MLHKKLAALIICPVSLFAAAGAFADIRTQFIPTVSITEEYTDNYGQTANNTEDEWTTIYAPGFSFGMIGRKGELIFSYNPEYTDYDDHDENDAWSHEVSLSGNFQLGEHTDLFVSDTFLRDLTRTVRTNAWQEHDTNTAEISMDHQFGERNSAGIGYSYSSDNYDVPNADEYKTHNPSASLSYWFTPQYGMDLNGSWEKTKYEISTDEPETWSGDIRLRRNITRHFDVYVSYAHTYTDQETGDHTIYNPSIGFDWQPDEDSGISIGAGVLFHEWDDPSRGDTENLFIDFDVYRNFNFSRRGNLGITGSSGYEATGEDAASLGFHIYYEAGVLLTYELARTLSAELSSTYTIDQFDDPLVDRQDNTLGLGAGLVWSPLRWLNFSLRYEFTDFNTDDSTREDYQENVGMFTITMTPSQPLRMGQSDSRAELENRLFD